MLTITDGGSLARALSLPIDARLKSLLAERFGQVDGRLEGEARFVVAQPGDGLRALENELGFSVFENEGVRFGDPDFSPRAEWIADHGYCWELCFVFTDDGFAHVLFVQNSALQNRQLRALCLAYAE